MLYYASSAGSASAGCTLYCCTGVCSTSSGADRCDSPTPCPCCATQALPGRLLLDVISAERNLPTGGSDSLRVSRWARRGEAVAPSSGVPGSMEAKATDGGLAADMVRAKCCRASSVLTVTGAAGPLSTSLSGAAAARWSAVCLPAWDSSSWKMLISVGRNANIAALYRKSGRMATTGASTTTPSQNAALVYKKRYTPSRSGKRPRAGMRWYTSPASAKKTNHRPMLMAQVQTCMIHVQKCVISAIL
mmetsp:Transcript_30475/g.78830  ORF Transcript_30475/g.78830 Transcript_30475/m.78830 type:complete len:247 (-) Transcript_30475:1497-2237(-)